MVGFLFMGMTITPNSHLCDESGAWLPSAMLHNATGTEVGTIADPHPCPSQAEADEVALRLAKRYIRKNLHQG